VPAQAGRLAVILVLGTVSASAHVGDRGVDYSRYRDRNGAPCCDHTDCRPADGFVDARERGQVRLLIEGTWIDVPHAHVVAEDAGDGRAHWCGGRLFTNSHHGWIAFPWCVILPPRET
jgi:hypothetical protein